MTRKFSNAAGKASFALMLLAALTFGTVYGLMQRDTPVGIATAESVVETLSKSWQFADIAPEFSPVVMANADVSSIQRSIAQFHRLGRLTRMRNAQMSSYRVSYTQADGFHRRATLTMVAEFENGEAAITITLITSGGVALLQHLDFKALRMPPPEAPRRLA